MGLLIGYVLFTLSISFLCSMMESTLLSVSNSYIGTLVNKGNKAGEILQEFKESIERPIAAILTLNTIANTMGATAAGAQAQLVFKDPWISAFAVIFTVAILVFSEIIPKTLGALYWKSLAPFGAYIIKFMIIVTYPFILIAQLITRLLGGESAKNEATVTREELGVMAEIGEEEGVLEGWEEKIIKNMLTLNKIKVKDIMTPRTVVFSFQKDKTVKEILEIDQGFPFSRIPVIGSGPDDIVGFVLRRDLLESATRGEYEKMMGELAIPIYSVPESLSIAKAMETFIDRHEHLFLVIDEFGGTAGIVTLEDAIETLLGHEILDEVDTIPDMRALAVKNWHSRRRKLEIRDKKLEQPQKEVGN